jgi:hypothetical protein
MRLISLSCAAIAALQQAHAANAKTYNVANTSKKGMKKMCAGHGTFGSGENSYSCTYKNGNIRECSRATKKCITETPSITADPKNPKRDPAGLQPGLLETQQGSSPTGPSPTGTPSSAGAVGAPAGQIR